ncbi:MAG: signal peptidase I [Armatimonadetes bacterium]|nr:signal peptidase I [Armatimonadota bacterium]
MKPRKVVQHVVELLLLGVILAVVGLRLWVYEPVRVREESMMDTLHDGDVLLVNRLKTKHRLPERGTIIVLARPHNREWVVKRVVAVGGDTVAVARNGRVWLNRKQGAEPYAKPYYGEERAPLKVPAGQVYVLGDNRGHSEDSRDYGCIQHEDIVGEVVRLLKRAKPGGRRAGLR